MSNDKDDELEAYLAEYKRLWFKSDERKPETSSSVVNAESIKLARVLWESRCEAVKAMTQLACRFSGVIDPMVAFACARELESDINRLLHNQFEV